MDLVAQFITKAQKNPARIVYPEGTDARILEAAVRSSEMGIARPIVLGAEEEIRKLAAEKRLSLTGIMIVSCEDEKRLTRYGQAYASARGVKEGLALKLVRKPMSFAAMMVKTGDGDAMVAGATCATASVLQSASLGIGFAPGLSTPSSFFLMIIPECLGEKDKVLLFADCAVNISPNAQQLAEIGVASGMSAKSLLGIEPKIAFLSFSTKGSAAHADVDKVREAVEIARKLRPDFQIDGELQGDSALVPRVAAKKVKESPVAGQANVLVFPDLDAGNICYKLTQYLANAKALGPVLQGFAKPVTDLSRGATVEDIVAVSAITAVQAMGSSEEKE